MERVSTWLADDRRTQRVFWVVAALSIIGGVVSVAYSQQHRPLTDAVLLLNVGLVVAVMILRALAVRLRWVGALGVVLQVGALVLHWRPAGAAGLIAGAAGWVILVVLVFATRESRAPEEQDDGVETAIAGGRSGEQP